jgi:hypothetical protein
MSKNTKNNASESRANARAGEPSLDSRYGEIGISAVAAALPFRSEAKKPAPAPSGPIPDSRVAEMAA